MVLAFAAIGILLARAAPSPIIGPLLIAAIFQAQPGEGDSWGAWLLPLWHNVAVQSGASVPCEPGHPVPGCGLVFRHLPGMGWHLSYLIGVTLLAGAAALVRGRRALPFAALAALAAALAITTKFSGPCRPCGRRENGRRDTGSRSISVDGRSRLFSYQLAAG